MDGWDKPGRGRRRLFLFDQILAERAGRRKLLARGFYIAAFTGEIFGDRALEPGMGDVMRRIGRVGQVAARELVLALGARLNAREFVLDRVFDRLIVADLEMQEGMVLDGAPVAAVERVGAINFIGAGDEA